MGSIGNNTVNSEIQTSNQIRQVFIQKALNSRLAGVRRDAENGTGNYSFKSATPANNKQVMKMTNLKFMEKDGNTLVQGLIDNKPYFYANTSDSPIIKELRNRENELREKANIQTERPEITPTSTYNRWKKQNDAKFASWFGKRS